MKPSAETDILAFLSAAGCVTGISVAPVALTEPFLDTAARFSEAPGTVVLASGGDLDCARYHILAVRPWLEIRARGRQAEIKACGRTMHLEGDPFALLRDVLRRYRVMSHHPEIPVGAGLFGYLSYDLKEAVEDLPRTCMDDTGLPHLCVFAPSVMLTHDNVTGRTWACAPVRRDETNALINDEMRAVLSAIQNRPKRRKPFSCGASGLRSSFSRPAYLEAVQNIKDYIRSGDIYQVNLSQRFETDFSGSPFDLFRTLYETAPGPFYAFVNAGDHQIISTSPERFLKQTGRRVETRPIKGTRPRGTTPDEDRAFADDLLQSPKDDAELSMIVDLMRNDLGRVCRGGTVRVAEHRRLEAYHNVFHLVSIVEGALMPDKDSVDLLRAAFPGGSITGCPRIRAMEIIDELEPVRRHVYTGSIGYVSFHDTLDLSIAIRTATVHDNRLLFSVGGGVVYDSDPAQEYEETLHKAKTLMGVLGTGNRREPGDEWVWLDGRILPKNQAVLPLSCLGVQYGHGFFETLRVEKGVVRFLNDHVRRFERSWKALLGSDPPDLTWKDVISQVIDRNSLQNKIAAVKLMAFHGEPGGGPFSHHLAVTARQYAPRPALAKNGGLTLATFSYPRQTPLADHKTLNYLFYYLAGKWASENGADEALILNPDGTVSETNTANMLLIKDKTVIRPESPHVLPGVMEHRVLQCLEKSGYTIYVRKVTPAGLLEADGVLLTNSLMGAVPALMLDGRPLPVEKGLCQNIANAPAATA